MIRYTHCHFLGKEPAKVIFNVSNWTYCTFVGMDITLNNLCTITQFQLVSYLKLRFNNHVSPCSVKLKSGGNSLPLGSRVFGSRSSLKKAWAQACSGEMREEGVYSNRRDTRSMASGGVRVRNTCNQ